MPSPLTIPEPTRTAHRLPPRRNASGGGKSGGSVHPSMASRATVMVLAAALAVLLLAAASAPAASAGRAEPAAVARHENHQGSSEGEAEGWRGCEGANDEDECMMRRTLAAQTDYIYTQEHHN
ncbi:hypothetical protein U9M48_011557 [Paspalum notatum var. saurae]|uniref:Phytosulfokine n=1 Tax=Paspalum notatum var. saurae TaxID=547442 RepID=A0AAQ3SVP8_PASNO